MNERSPKEFTTTSIQRVITDDLEALLEVLPSHIVAPLRARGAADGADLLEIVMDLGRLPTARYPNREVVLAEREVTAEDLEYVVSRIGIFGDDNRAGIERTLHRISAIRNRAGRIIGLTLRVGRAVYGTIRIIEDLVRSGKSILLLGRPGVGKTTMLREAARVLADELLKRVVIVDTSNEIAGDGDIPHPGIGRARRMQVKTPLAQHAVMIEAVENHMPEVIVIDEIGTELEALAARTIAERGVQLVGTAHGTTLENLIANPTLSDLIGGIQSVTLGDEEARRRRTQKSILERKAPPTFDVVVEIQSWEQVAVHPDVAEAVDAILRGYDMAPEVRILGEDGEVRRTIAARPYVEEAPRGPSPFARPVGPLPSKRILPYGLSRGRLEQAIVEMQVPVHVTDDLEQADVVLTLKNIYRQKPPLIRAAEEMGIPIFALKSNTLLQIEQSLGHLFDIGEEPPADAVQEAIRETQQAIGEVLNGDRSVELSPQNAYIRRLQHQMAERFNLSSRSRGKEPYRRVKIYRDE